MGEASTNATARFTLAFRAQYGASAPRASRSSNLGFATTWSSVAGWTSNRPDLSAAMPPGPGIGRPSFGSKR